MKSARTEHLQVFKRTAARAGLIRGVKGLDSTLGPRVESSSAKSSVFLLSVTTATDVRYNMEP